MVVTHFMLEGRVVTGVMVGIGMGVAPVVVGVAIMVVVVTDDGALVTVTVGLVRVV